MITVVKILLLHFLDLRGTVKGIKDTVNKAAEKKAEFVSVSSDVPQRDYFCFYNYEYILDVSRQYELMPDTVSLEHGLRREFDWYSKNPDSVYYRKPYMDYIDKRLTNLGQ